MYTLGRVCESGLVHGGLSDLELTRSGVFDGKGPRRYHLAT